MHAAVQIAADGGQVGLALGLLGLPLGLAFEEPFLQGARLQVLLLAGPSERLVEPWHAFRLPPSVSLDPSPAKKQTIVKQVLLCLISELKATKSGRRLCRLTSTVGLISLLIVSSTSGSQRLSTIAIIISLGTWRVSTAGSKFQQLSPYLFTRVPLVLRASRPKLS